jgi:hypothetical protein
MVLVVPASRAAQSAPPPTVANAAPFPRITSPPRPVANEPVGSVNVPAVGSVKSIVPPTWRAWMRPKFALRLVAPFWIALMDEPPEFTLNPRLAVAPL